MSKGISHPVFYGDLVYKLRRVKDTPNFISFGSKIVKRLRKQQCDPLIIERTIGHVLGPSTALYRPFLKHCTLTNKAVWTLWRALSKPPQNNFKCVSLWLHGGCREWEGWARKPVNHTSWVAIATTNDRPKSVRNRCVSELFCGDVCIVTLPFWHFCWCKSFCRRTESDLFFFS